MNASKIDWSHVRYSARETAGGLLLCGWMFGVVFSFLIVAVGTAMAIPLGFIWLFFGEAPRFMPRPMTIYACAWAWLGLSYWIKKRWMV